MEETAQWLARALARVREADPADRPTTAAADLADALRDFGGAERLAGELIRRVWAESAGTVALSVGRSGEFIEQWRGPVVHLVLSVRKRVSVVPTVESPVRFDSGQGLWLPVH